MNNVYTLLLAQRGAAAGVSISDFGLQIADLAPQSSIRNLQSAMDMPARRSRQSGPVIA
jgi:hypothetical protein